MVKCEVFVEANEYPQKRFNNAEKLIMWDIRKYEMVKWKIFVEANEWPREIPQ